MSGRLSFGRLSLGLALASLAFIFAMSLVTFSILAGHPTLLPPRSAVGPGRLAGYEPLGRVAVGVVFGCALAALILGVIGIRREKSTSSWIGAFGGLLLVVPFVASLGGLALERLGVGQDYGTALMIAAPNLVLGLIALVVGRWVWRAVRQGPPRR